MLLSSPAALEKYVIPKACLKSSVVQPYATSLSSVGADHCRQPSPFTNKELHELTSLSGASMRSPRTGDSRTSVKREAHAQAIAPQAASPAAAAVRYPNSHTKSWSFDFFRSPTAVAPAPSGHQNEPALMLSHTALDVSALAVRTGATSVLPTSSFTRSDTMRTPHRHISIPRSDTCVLRAVGMF